MRKYLTLVLGALALVAVAAVGMASAANEGNVTVHVGPLTLTAGGGFTPKVLSKTAQTPIALKVEGEVKKMEGAEELHPPAAREIFIEFDKGGEVHTKGIPACPVGRIEATETAAALKACESALIGEGQAIAQVQFADQRPINVNTKVLVFNGGEKGGKTTMLIHGYFSSPISGAIVTTVTITKHKNGRFGTLAVAKIPQITGGAGSITSFHLEIFKDVKVGGKTYNPISATCYDGKLKAHVEAKFEEGTKAALEIIRACTPKG